MERRIHGRPTLKLSHELDFETKVNDQDFTGESSGVSTSV